MCRRQPSQGDKQPDYALLWGMAHSTFTLNIEHNITIVDALGQNIYRRNEKLYFTVKR